MQNINLEHRGIATIAQQAGWKKRKNYYTVPTFTLDGRKTKFIAKYNISSYTRNLYGKVNLAGKPDDLYYYILPGTAEAIQRAKGVCYLAAGLTDLLSYHAAQFPNVISFLAGEMSIPKTFVDDLKSLGVTKLIYLPDSDEVGQFSATAVHKALHGSNITYSARQIGAFDDVGAAWAQLAAFSGAASEQVTQLFQQWIANCPEMEFEAAAGIAALREKVGERRAKPDDEKTIPSDDVRTQLMQRLNIPPKWKLKQNGARVSKNIRSPFRDDGEHADCVLFDNPDGSLVLYDFATGQSHTTHDLCKHFGISLTHSESSRVQREQMSTDRFFDWRIALIQNGYTDVARLLDALNYAGVAFINSENNELTALGFDDLYKKVEAFYGESTLRRKLKELIAEIEVGLGNHDIDEKLSRRCPFSFISELSGVCETNSRRGPKAKRYPLPNRDYLLAGFGVEVDFEGDNLPPKEALVSDSAYKAWLHAEYVRQESDYWEENEYFPATKTFAKRLNVSGRTIRRYEDDTLEIIRTPRDPILLDIGSHPRPLNEAELVDGYQWVEKRLNEDGSRYYVAIKPRSSKRKWVEKPPSNLEFIAEHTVWCCECGQSYNRFLGPPPDTCDFCGKITLWIEKPLL